MSYGADIAELGLQGAARKAVSYYGGTKDVHNWTPKGATFEIFEVMSEALNWSQMRERGW